MHDWHDPILDPGETEHLNSTPGGMPWWLGYLVLIGFFFAWSSLLFYSGKFVGALLILAIVINGIRLFIRKANIVRDKTASRQVHEDPVTLLPVDGRGRPLPTDCLFQGIINISTGNGPVAIRHYISKRNGRSMYFSDGGRCWARRDTPNGLVMEEIDRNTAWAEFYKAD